MIRYVITAMCSAVLVVLLLHAAPPAPQPGAAIMLPTGTILILLQPAGCPTGYTEATGLVGSTIVGTTLGAGNVGTSGGSDTITAAGTVSAPVFTGTPMASHAHELPIQLGAVPRFLPSSTFGSGTSRVSAMRNNGPVDVTSAPVALSQGISAGTPAGSVSAPSFTGVPMDNRSKFVRVIFCVKI